MQPSNITSINWGATNGFTGYVYDGNIFTYTGEQIGVNLAKYQEVEQALVKCKNRLIALGEIKLPKTPEQIIQEKQALLDRQSAAITQLLEKVNELELHPKSATAEHSQQCTDCTTTSITDSGPVINQDEGRCDKGSTKSKKSRTTRLDNGESE
jgi:hypothetical protein